MQIKVLNVIDSLYAGGAESLLKNFLIESKKYKDFEVDILTLYNKVFYTEINNYNIKYFSLNLSFKYDFTKIFHLVKLIKENNYDIVHVHLFPADIFGAIASLFFNKKPVFIFSEHNVYNRRRSIPLYKPIDRFVYSRYSKIICVSELVKKELNKYLPESKEKSVVIKNAVLVRNELHRNNNFDWDILFVGRLEEAKGVDILLKAIHFLKTQNNLELKVAIVGSGSKKDEYENLSKQLGLNNSVKFLGLRNDIQALMQSSKIFVLPSRWEGLPMVILEAMANGIPIIATKVGGIPEVIKDGVNGLMVEKEDIAGLAEKIYRLLNDTLLQQILSKNAYETVKNNYSIEVYTKTLLGLYEDILYDRK